MNIAKITQIVDKKSARLKIANEILDGINDADHSPICKFRRLDSRSYTMFAKDSKSFRDYSKRRVLSILPSNPFYTYMYQRMLIAP